MASTHHRILAMKPAADMKGKFMKYISKEMFTSLEISWPYRLQAVQKIVIVVVNFSRNTAFQSARRRMGVLYFSELLVRCCFLLSTAMIFFSCLSLLLL